MKRSRIEAIVYLLGLAGLVVAVRSVSGSSGQLPGPIPLVGAGLAGLVSILAAGHQWSSLLGLEGRDGLVARRSFYTAQLSKYLPGGGAVQVTSQFVLTKRLGIPGGRIAAATLLAALHSATSGLALGVLIVFEPELPTWIRIAVLGLPLVLMTSHPAVLRLLFRLVARVSGRFERANPSFGSASIVRSLALGLVNLVTIALSFAILAHAADGDLRFVPLIGAFCLAWTAGFVVLPLPSGVGVREVALLFLVPSTTEGVLLTAAVGQRLLTLVAEVSVVAVAALWSRVAQPATR